MKYVLSAIVSLITYTNAVAFNENTNFTSKNGQKAQSKEWLDSANMWKQSLSKRNQAWFDNLERAKSHPAFSKETKENYFHFCEKETKTCTNAIFFEGSKNIMMMAEITDYNNRLLMRSTCYFPRKEMDVRICQDFDRGNYNKSIQNADGNWEIIMQSASS